MHAFITGAGGFIGSHLVDLLIQQNHTVTAMLKPGEDDEFVHPDARRVVGDINDLGSMARAMPQADTVYHLAARSDLNSSAVAAYSTNTTGTSNVLEAARRACIRRFVYYSSMLSAAMPPDEQPVDETFHRPAETAYGQSKHLAEEIVRQSSLPWTIIRPTFVFGPRERTTTHAMFRAISKKRFVLIGPDAPQSFVYVKNLVEATYQASLHPDAQDETFFISDARPYALAEFAGKAAQAMGKKLPGFRLPVPGAMALAYLLKAVSAVTGVPAPLFPSRVRTMTRPYVYSIEKAKRLFNYNPPYSLEDALAETIQWYRRQNML